MKNIILASCVFLFSLSLLASGGGGGSSGGASGGASSRSQNTGPKSVQEARDMLRQRMKQESIDKNSSGTTFSSQFPEVSNLLSKSVVMKQSNQKSFINYSQIKVSEVNKVSAHLLSFSKDQVMNVMNKKQRLAYFINLYNVMTIKFIKDNYKLIKKENNSIKDVGSIFKSSWDRKFFTLFGQQATLNNIEHGFIRGDVSGYNQSKKEYDDPRIHFAVNCASKGCPALLNESFTEAKLEDQLQRSMINFLKDRSRNKLRHISDSKKELVLSPIFKWYKKDFSKGLKGYDSLKDFAQKNAKYLGDSATDIKIIKSGKFSIDYSDYDWTLNDEI